MSSDVATLARHPRSMALIDITSELYSDVTSTRTITARQLLEIDNVVAIRVVDRESPEHTVWVRVDEIDTCRKGTGQLTLIRVQYDDETTWACGPTDHYFFPNQKIDVAIVG